ncbi:Nn.00g116110.m01.CDS01 [Neocucurbitaria sp. VM-36]
MPATRRANELEQSSGSIKSQKNDKSILKHIFDASDSEDEEPVRPRKRARPVEYSSQDVQEKSPHGEEAVMFPDYYPFEGEDDGEDIEEGMGADIDEDFLSGVNEVKLA